MYRAPLKMIRWGNSTTEIVQNRAKPSTFARISRFQSGFFYATIQPADIHSFLASQDLRLEGWRQTTHIVLVYNQILRQKKLVGKSKNIG